MEYIKLCQRLHHLYSNGESRAIVSMLLDEWFGMSMADAMCGGLDALSAEDQSRVEDAMKRLEQGEPVQYVLGVADFCGHRFSVCPGVLIPRPETEQLCQLVLSRLSDCPSPAVLDVCTGSGCIAVTLALALPNSSVEAWDISLESVQIATSNASKLGAHVNVACEDALCPPDSHCMWDAVVSNPPYICNSERTSMHANVLEYEPELALFVPDDDPLLFYRSIATYAQNALKPGGHLCFEVNALYADDVASMLDAMGYADAIVIDDMYGRHRFVCAVKKCGECAVKMKGEC